MPVLGACQQDGFKMAGTFVSDGVDYTRCDTCPSMTNWADKIQTEQATILMG